MNHLLLGTPIDGHLSYGVFPSLSISRVELWSQSSPHWACKLQPLLGLRFTRKKYYWWSLMDSIKTWWESPFLGMWEGARLFRGKTIPFKPNREMMSCQGTGRNVSNQPCHGMEAFCFNLETFQKTFERWWSLMFHDFSMIFWNSGDEFPILEGPPCSPQAADVVPGLLLGAPGISGERRRALR